MSQITKSPLIAQKELELAELKIQLKKYRTQLKRNKTMLQNLKESVIEMQDGLMTRMMEQIQACVAVKQRIIDLLDQVQQSDKFDASEKEQAINIIEEIKKVDFGETPPQEDSAEEETEERQDGEHGRGRFAQFEQFSVELDETEKKNIRKTYIKLAARFHPDKAKDEKEAEFFHQLMQRINEAYKAGDIHELLEIEREYASYQSTETRPEEQSEVLSFVEKQIERVTRELNLIEGQLKRVKSELSNLKKSEVGEMVKEEKKAQKYGYTSQSELALLELEEVEEDFGFLEESLQHLLENGSFPEEMYDQFGSLASNRKRTLHHGVTVLEKDGEAIELTEDELLEIIMNMYD